MTTAGPVHANRIIVPAECLLPRKGRRPIAAAHAVSSNRWTKSGPRAPGPQGRDQARLQWAVMEFKRITTDARQMGGVPCLRGLRIPVATIVSLVAEGQTPERILALYPDLEADDVREALLFAAEAVRERTLPLAAGQ